MPDTMISAMTDLSPIVSTDYIPIVRSGANGKAQNIQSSLGITDASSAAAGQIGEVIASSVAEGSAVALTSTQYKEFASVALTAGYWQIDVLGTITGGAITNLNNALIFIGTAAGNNTTGQNTATNTCFISCPLSGTYASGFVRYYVNISSPATYYAKAMADFGFSSLSVFGTITATRAR